MSDIMSCMPFEQLLNWVRTEHDEKGTVFGVHSPYVADQGKAQTIFGRKLRRPSARRQAQTANWRRISRHPTMREAVSSN